MSDLQPAPRVLQAGMAESVQGRARYGAALAAVSGLQIAALADADTRAAKLQARELGSKPAIFPDLAALLAAAPSLDAFLLTVPMAQRSNQSIALLNAGLCVLCEAPIGLSLDEADAAIGAAGSLLPLSPASAARPPLGSSGLPLPLLMPAFPRRFDALFDAAKQQMDAGAIGELRQARYEWSLPIGETENAGDAIGHYDWNVLIQQVVCQSADICLFWFGAALSVSADIEFLSEPLLVPARRGQKPSASAAVLLVTHERGTVTHHVTRTRASFRGERCVLSGSQGDLELLARGGTSLSTASAPTLTRHQPGLRPEILYTGAGFHIASAARVLLLLEHFADCVRGTAIPRITAHDARAAQEIVHAAYLSSAENSKVNLPLRRSIDIEALLRGANEPPSLPSPLAPL